MRRAQSCSVSPGGPSVTERSAVSPHIASCQLSVGRHCSANKGKGCDLTCGRGFWTGVLSIIRRRLEVGGKALAWVRAGSRTS